ncbi:MAG: dienelactone hydrolase family protein [Clostridiaceae bacterium]
MDKPKTAVVLLHEIYGINNHILSIYNKFRNEGYDTYCIDLLNGKTFNYDKAEEAYSYFMNEIGFENAKLKVLNYISANLRNYDKVFLLGYSIGVTAAWLCSEEKGLVSGVIGYYGSRVRDYLNVEPEVPVLFFFPSKERGFEISPLIDKLKNKEKVWVYQFEGLHGFADSYSEYYDYKSKYLSEKILDEFITCRTNKWISKNIEVKK